MENAAISPQWAADEYQLLDFGNGRKLESFAGVRIDRPCPAAQNSRPNPQVDWSAVAARLAARGKIVVGQVPEQGWQVRFGELRFQLKLTPFGHLGLFPEQASNWHWLIQQLPRTASERRLRALNLFAYTGGTTMVLAAAGVEVVHVDASAPAVKWARGNATNSGLDGQPIRWIVEDARKFVQREIRRGNHYDIIVLDPPSYGHGPGGKRWNIDEDLHPLLEDCFQLLTPQPALLLLTAHSDTLDERGLASSILQHAPTASCARGRLELVAAQDARLDAGFFVRCRF